MLLDSNNFNFIEKFMHSALFENLTFFDMQEELKSYFGNLYYLILQTLSKPNAKMDLLNVLFSKEKIVNYFNLVIINNEISSFYKRNLISNFDLLVKEIIKNLDSNISEEYKQLSQYLNYLSEKLL